METATIDFATALPEKTDLGRQEIETRALRLPPLPRRLLLLVDGKRTTDELAAFVPGQDVQAMLANLTERGCIEWKSAAAPAPAAATQAAAHHDEHPIPHELDTLPAPETRTSQQTEMARNFMINTINTMHAQYSRLTQVEHISSCKDAAELRQQFAAWKQAMLDSRIGAKRLPELTDKLLAIL